ncbi:MAG: hypothetical protein KF875_07495 [Trueperaceae bacterium]|nr:hypothetical protein [Trueperaceae bacterium]MCC6311050.1 hypothetical protein [Trueperaceae bacterium]MCO5173619.1 hypothetical protein [Trueperaceae bacterium]MCW5819800.1 hypothetical protein [Trueperaceae bacterium]
MALTEVIVLIPEERVGDFYRVVGAWMGGANLVDESNVGRGRRRNNPSSTPLVLSNSSRYYPLHRHLANVSKDTKSYEMSFDEITTVMGDRLPKSAEDHRAWWANTESHSQALAWISAGWKVDGVDLVGRLIHFTRPK